MIGTSHALLPGYGEGLSDEGAMRLAISVWNDRISPVFDTASQLLVVDYAGGSETARRWIALQNTLPHLRARQLAELGIEVLICGSMSRTLQMILAGSGVKVASWKSGPAEEALVAYFSGELDHPRWAMPGCGCRRRRRRSGLGGKNALE